MTYRIRVHPDAADELESAADWYDEKRSGLGEEFRDSITRAVEKIRTGRTPGTTVPSVKRAWNIRRLLLSRFPYAVVFQILDGEFVILAFAHQRRRPGYWRHRVGF